MMRATEIARKFCTSGKAIKIGNCIPYKGSCKRNWMMKWDPTHTQKIKDNAGRVYVILSRDVQGVPTIKKIGKSECKGGMKTTFAFYQGGLGGSPSIRTFGIHLLIANELNIGNAIEIWGIWTNPITIKVSGLFEEEEQVVYPSIHSMEDKCRRDYQTAVGNYPPWNFQERGAPWPEFVQLEYKKQVASRPTQEEREAMKKQKAEAKLKNKQKQEQEIKVV